MSVNTSSCYRPHAHAEVSLGVVDEGQAVFHHPDGPHRVQAGSVVLIEPGVVHACNPGTSRRWSYRMLFLDADWLHRQWARQVGRPVSGLSFSVRRLDDPVVYQWADHLCRPLLPSSPVDEWAEQVVARLAEVSSPRASSGEASASGAIDAALALMRTQPDARHTVAALAEACGLSPTQFIRRFQAAHGLTPGRWLQNQRVNGARRLLAQGLALADAAHAMGFVDQAHMHRAFKALHAMTPGAYRTPPRLAPKT